MNHSSPAAAPPMSTTQDRQRILLKTEKGRRTSRRIRPSSRPIESGIRVPGNDTRYAEPGKKR